MLEGLRKIRRRFGGSRWRFRLGIALALTLCVYLTFLYRFGAHQFLGVMEADRHEVRYQEGGRLAQLFVRVGETVKPGMPLARLEFPGLDLKIEELRSRLQASEAEQRLSAEVGGGSKDSPLAAEIRGLHRSLAVLNKQRRGLTVRSERVGVVTGVHFQVGEQVPPFETILSIHGEKPTYVKGFIPETLPLSLKAGATVTVRSVMEPGRQIQGRVRSVAKVLLPCPQRLLPFPNYTGWGREVIVEVPPHSGFLLSEKAVLEVKKGNYFEQLFRVADQAFNGFGHAARGT